MEIRSVIQEKPAKELYLIANILGEEDFSREIKIEGINFKEGFSAKVWVDRNTPEQNFTVRIVIYQNDSKIDFVEFLLVADFDDFSLATISVSDFLKYGRDAQKVNALVGSIIAQCGEFYVDDGDIWCSFFGYMESVAIPESFSQYIY